MTIKRNDGSVFKLGEPTPTPKQEPVIVEKSYLAWLLPAEVVEHHDHLYDEKRDSIRYLAKKQLNITIKEQKDKLIATSNEKITPSSILYIEELNEWWQIATVTEKNSLFNIIGYVSNLRPKF